MESARLAISFFQNVHIPQYQNKDCWVWVGSKDNDGYGKFSGLGEKQSHRFAYVFYSRDVLTSEDCIIHSCDNPYCVSPYHLSKGTKAENNADRKQKHFKNEPSGRQFTKKEVFSILDEYHNQCHSQYQIAAKYGKSRPAITNIINKKTRREWVEDWEAQQKQH